jgi:predicted enzyme related to lactoylglutathione lyase
MPRVVHFEVHAENPERCARFYAAAFGWAITHIPDLDYWIMSTGEGRGIDGGMVRRRSAAPHSGQPVNAFVCTLGVDNLDAASETVLNLGASLALPRFSLPGIGHTAYFTDTEGNIFGLHEADPDAV